MLLELLQTRRFKNCNSVIIYCTRREQTERLASLVRTILSKKGQNSDNSLRKKGGNSDPWSAESYHAGLSAAHRKRIQKQFMKGWDASLEVIFTVLRFAHYKKLYSTDHCRGPKKCRPSQYCVEILQTLNITNCRPVYSVFNTGLQLVVFRILHSLIGLCTKFILCYYSDTL